MQLGTIETIQIRPADLVLSWELNPTGDRDIGKLSGHALRKACGIIPDFFASACLESDYGENLTRANVAEAMDRHYGCGGFAYPWSGTLSPEGYFETGEWEDDCEDWAPLVRLHYTACDGVRGYELFIFDYGVAALREIGSSEAVVGRFD